MNINTRAVGFELTPAIDEFARSNLVAALGRIDEDIITIDVFMKDTNGPRGGVDKQVLVCVRLRNRQQVAVVTKHEDLYAAIVKSTKRSKRAVRRQLRKSRRFEKQRMNELLSTGLAGSSSID